MVEEIKIARQNLGRYTRKISQEYEEEDAVRMEDLRQSLISLLNVVRHCDSQSRAYLYLYLIHNEITIKIKLYDLIMILDQKKEGRF